MGALDSIMQVVFTGRKQHFPKTGKQQVFCACKLTASDSQGAPWLNSKGQYFLHEFEHFHITMKGISCSWEDFNDALQSGSSFYRTTVFIVGVCIWLIPSWGGGEIKKYQQGIFKIFFVSRI